MKFTSEQCEYINKTRDKILELNEQQHKLYNDLINNLNIPFQAEDWMFDYIYNEFGSIDDIEERITDIN